MESLISQCITMPFTKETASIEGKKGIKAREKNKHDLWALIAGGHKDDYNKKLERLKDGGELSKPESEFMDRVEKLFPYTKARKTDVTSDGEKIIPIPILDVSKDNSNGKD